ncbi:33247_t:CDS:2, partial [Racocetra persica]
SSSDYSLGFKATSNKRAGSTTSNEGLNSSLEFKTTDSSLGFKPTSNERAGSKLLVRALSSKLPVMKGQVQTTSNEGLGSKLPVMKGQIGFITTSNEDLLYFSLGFKTTSNERAGSKLP